MKKFFMSILVSFLCISSCLAKDLNYAGNDFESVHGRIFTTSSGSQYLIFKKTVSPSFDLAMGMSPSSYTNFIIALIVVNNFSQKPYLIKAGDFLIKDNQGFAINMVPIEYYASLRNNAQNQETTLALNNANKKAYTATTNYSGFNNSTYNLGYNSINGNGYSSGTSTTSIQEDPFANLANSINRNIAVNNSIATSKMLDDMLRHSFKEENIIPAFSSRYYYLTIEKPTLLPLILKYKNEQYIFDKKKPKKTKL